MHKLFLTLAIVSSASASSLTYSGSTQVNGTTYNYAGNASVLAPYTFSNSSSDNSAIATLDAQANWNYIGLITNALVTTSSSSSVASLTVSISDSIAVTNAPAGSSLVAGGIIAYNDIYYPFQSPGSISLNLNLGGGNGCAPASITPIRTWVSFCQVSAPINPGMRTAYNFSLSSTALSAYNAYGSDNEVAIYADIDDVYVVDAKGGYVRNAIITGQSGFIYSNILPTFIPEPSSLGLCGLPMLLAGFAYLRRARRLLSDVESQTRLAKL